MTFKVLTFFQNWGVFLWYMSTQLRKVSFIQAHLHSGFYFSFAHFFSLCAVYHLTAKPVKKGALRGIMVAIDCGGNSRQRRK
jgi:hypothetical protein